MKIFISFAILISFLTSAYGSTAEKPKSAQKPLELIYSEYKQGNYEIALDELNKISTENIEGLVHYWKGLCLLRMNEFDPGIEELEKAIASGYKTSDLFYEYGQALYTSLKLKKARVAFKKSILEKYKMAVSMYYIASISQELGDYKTAATFYNGIERLPMSEKKDVVQAARMQLGDIYLNQIKSQNSSTASIEKYVLPQYRKALEWDEEGPLASEIRAKIETIERRYDLVLFQLRNGRPTVRPPYFLKANLKYSMNDNVNALDEDTKSSLSSEQYAATSSDVGAYGRYTFYPNSAFSVTPQFNFNYTRYLSEEALITQNDNYHATATLQTAYEHSYNSAPATLYLNIDYTYSADDFDQDEQVEKASTALGFTLSEELRIWKNNPSIFRIKHKETTAVEEGGDFSSTGGVFEQGLIVGNSMLYLYSAYEMNRYADLEISNNDSMTFRVDALLPDYKGLFNTNLYASTSEADYIEDADRGATRITTYGVNLNRPFGKHYFAYIDFGLSSQTGARDSDNYGQQILALNLDYIF